MFRTCAAVNVPEKDSEPVAVFSLVFISEANHGSESAVVMLY